MGIAISHMGVGALETICKEEVSNGEWGEGRV